MIRHNTKLGDFQQKFFNLIKGPFEGDWNRRSFALISLLIGFYIGSNITAYYLEKFGQRPILVLIIVLIIEVLVRLRNIGFTKKWVYLWLAIDNLRLGTVYAVVLEAFKLGS